MAGNTKLIESITLKEVYPKQDLANKGAGKLFTRHFNNIYLYLDPTECALFSWLVGYSDGINTFTYSTILLRQFDKASDRAMEIYGVDKVKYKTSRDNARTALISLIEKGLIIRISGKNRFMINPYVVFTNDKNRFYKIPRHKEYLEIVNKYSGQELQNKLTELCNSIEKFYTEYNSKYGKKEI